MTLPINEIICGDALEVLKTFPDESIDCVVTSPPYWGLRDYGVEGQLGLEKTPEEYVAKMVEVFREIKRVLKKEGVMFLNLGDSYAAGGNGGGTEKQDSNRGTLALKGKVKKAPPGLKPKDLVGIPWRVAFALQADGWYLRQDIIWAKPNPMPESVTDRCTKSHEYIFLLSKNQKYYFDNEAIMEDTAEPYSEKRTKRPATSHGKEPTPSGSSNNLTYNKIRPNSKRNKRSVWTIATKPYKEAHFATFPKDLIIPMVKAGCPKGRLVLDPFMGSGTTAYVARSLGRNFIGIELSSAYISLAKKRLAQQVLL